MVAKLIKHQMRDDVKVLGLLYGVALAMCAGLYLARPLVGQTLYTVMSALLVLLSAGINLITMAYFGMRYYKTMYGNEGYLMQTLPVNENLPMFVKIAIGYGEMMLSNGVMLVSMLLMFNAVNIDLSVLTSVGTSMLLVIISAVMVQTAMYIMMIILSITFANTSYLKGDSPFMSLAVLAVLYVIMQVATVASMLLIPLVLKDSGNGLVLSNSFMLGDIITNPEDISLGLGFIIVQLLFVIGCFSLASRFNKKKVIIR